MEVIIALFIVGILLAYSSIMGGLVVFKFWYWFVLPVFPELPNITYVQAIGLMLFIGLFKNNGKSNDNDNQKENLLLYFLTPILMLVVGGIVHAFIY